MYKLANQILDIYDDVMGEQIKLAAKIDPNINVMPISQRNELDQIDFALCVLTKEAGYLNRFPIADKDSTWLSNFYFDKNHLKLPEDAQKIAAYHIKMACDKFKIQPMPSVEALAASDVSSNLCMESELPHSKVASPIKQVDMSEFADLEKVAGNYTSAQYVMSTPSRVKIASEYFEQYHTKMPLEWRSKYAQSIQKRAHELGMPKVAGAVSKYASDYYSAQIDGELSKRASLLEDKPVMKLLLQKLGGMKSVLSPTEFSQHLHSFDKRAGIDKYYDGFIKNAYETTHGLENPNKEYLFKTANKSLTLDELTMLANAKYDTIKQYFGKNVADEFKKQPQAIFHSLPMDHKELLVDIANGKL